MVLIKIRGQIYNLSMLSKAEFIPAGTKGWKMDRIKMQFISLKVEYGGDIARRLWSILENQVIDNFDGEFQAYEAEFTEPMTTRERDLVADLLHRQLPARRLEVS